MIIEFEIMEAQNGFIGKVDNNFVIGKDENEIAGEIARLINEKKTDFKELAYAIGSICGNYQILFYVTKKTTIVEGWMKPREGDKWMTMGIVECDNHAESKEIEREFVNAHFPDRKKKSIYHTWKGEVLKQN